MSVTNLGQFNLEIEEFVRRVPPEQVVAVHKKIALEVLARVVLRTPVDTGRARGNWQTTIDVVPAEEQFSDDPVSAGVGALGGLQPYVTVFVSNNVEYIKYLDEGSSSQAPTGIVGPVLQEIRTIFP